MSHYSCDGGCGGCGAGADGGGEDRDRHHDGGRDNR